jgi:hypothetical protein
MKRARPILVLLLALVALPPAQGAVISAIRIRCRGVFDEALEARGAFPYRWGNALHVTTREAVIRGELLYGVGDELDPGKILETERNLRALGFLGEVTTDLRYSPDSASVEVAVTTQDQWSLTVAPLFPHGSGEDYQLGVALEEQNLLGRGKDLYLSSSTGRRARARFTSNSVSYADRNLFGTRHDLRLDWGADDKLHWMSSRLGRPARALEDRFTYGISASGSTGSEAGIESGVVRLHYHTFTRSFSADVTRRYGRRLGPRRQRLLSAGVTLYRNEWRYSSSPADAAYADLVPPDLSETCAALSAGYSRTRYETAEFVNNFGNLEDLAFGWSAQGGWTRSLPVFDGDRMRTIWDLAWSGSARCGSTLYASSRVAARRIPEGVTRNSSVSARVSVFLKAPRRMVTALRLSGATQSRPESYRLYYIGGDWGLRGYGPYQVGASEYALANMEERWFTPLHILTVDLGGVLFADVARVRRNGGAPAWSWESDAGAGILFGLGRLSNHPIVRIDAARRLGDGTLRWSLGNSFYFLL